MRCLKISICIFVCLCAICCSVWAQSESKKLYISKDAVKLTEEGIFLIIGEDQEPIGAIHSDEGGLYISLDEDAPFLMSKYGWQYCQNCNFCNEPHCMVCERCGHTYFYQDNFKANKKRRRSSIADEFSSRK